MRDTGLAGFAGITAEAARVFVQLGLQDPHKLAGHWSLRTPPGRAWLAHRAGAEELEVLRWAFAAELHQFGFPASDAERLVQRGTTLRDILGDVRSGKGERWRNKLGHADQAGLLDSPPAHLETLLDELPIHFYDLLAVSDFHMAAGNHPSPEGIARFSPTEDFFCDDAFFRFLYHCEQERRRRAGYPYELVLNGDMLDFAQVVIQPPDKWDAEIPLPFWFWDLELPSRTQGREDEAGRFRQRLVDILTSVYQFEWDHALINRIGTRPKAGPRKVRSMLRKEALDQLGAIYLGHPHFFQGLAWFLSQGNRLVLIRGNHDPQWYWPEVRMSFVLLLQDAYGQLSADESLPGRTNLPVPLQKLQPLPAMTLNDWLSRADLDHDWFYYRQHLAYLEHGGQQDGLNSHRYFLHPVCLTKRMFSSGVESWEGQAGSLFAKEIAPTAAGQLLVHTGAGGSAPPESWLAELRATNEEEELDPPMGSLGLVFFVNLLEMQLPNYEWPKHQEGYQRWLFFHKPGLLLHLLFGAGLRLLRAWKDWALRPLRERRLAAQHGYRYDHVNQYRENLHQDRLDAYARLSGMKAACVEELDATRWVKRWRKSRWGVFLVTLEILLLLSPLAAGIGALLLVKHQVQLSMIDLPTSVQDNPITSTLIEWGLGFLGGLVSYWLMTWLANFINLGEDFLYKPSRRVGRILAKYGHDVPFILFGHDHAHNAQPLHLGQFCHECLTELGKRHLGLEGIRVEPSSLRCPSCGSHIAADTLRHAVYKALPAVPHPAQYEIRCPHCGQETSIDGDTDLEIESVHCAHCQKDLSIILRAIESAPLVRAQLSALGPRSLDCPACGDTWPQALLNSISVIPPHAVLSCPKCHQEKRQWIGSWSLGCTCNRTVGGRNLRLTDDGVSLHCKCGRRYPSAAPAKRWYLNTGSWMHEYGKDRNMKRLMRAEHEYPFVRIIDTHRIVADKSGDSPDVHWMDPLALTPATVQLLRWNDALGRTEPCETFSGADEL